MGPDATRLADRLAAATAPRPGRGTALPPPRLPLGLPAADAALGGGLERGALHEIRAELAREIGAAAGVVLTLVSGLMQGPGARGRVLWVTDPAAAQDAGLLCPDGIAQYELDPAAFTLVQPVDLKTALWAAEEGARCTDLAAVVLQVKGNPRLLDRTAMRRLTLRARTSGTTVLLLRQSGLAEAGAAASRWRVTPRPSPPDPAYPEGIGLPQHALALENCRTGRTGRWPVLWRPGRTGFAPGTDSGAEEHDRTHTPHRLDRPAAPAHRPDRAGPLGQVVDLRRTP